MFDIAIVGNGPAGLSAAMTARMRNASCIVISPKESDGWLQKANEVRNYPGMKDVSGREMLDTFHSQARDLGAEFTDGLVRQILYSGGAYMLLVENDIIEAKAVILAMGAKRAKLLDGEAELVGNGVSYCATCDGMFYRSKNIAVLSATEQGIHEANFLADLAAQVTYYSLMKHDMGSLDARIAVNNEKPSRLERQDAHICVNDTPYDGVFIIRPAVALSQLLPNLIVDGAFIPVDRQMKTNLDGVYAAGDCTGQPLQIAKAVGEGNVAAISAGEYLLSKHK